MPPRCRERRSSRLPSVDFHMSTRRRSQSTLSQPASPQVTRSSTESFTTSLPSSLPPTRQSSRPTTPLRKNSTSSSISSPLSSIPASVGSTPRSLEDIPESDVSPDPKNFNPSKRHTLKRKASGNIAQADPETVGVSASKKRKSTSEPSTSEDLSPEQKPSLEDQFKELINSASNDQDSAPGRRTRRKISVVPDANSTKELKKGKSSLKGTSPTRKATKIDEPELAIESTPTSPPDDKSSDSNEKSNSKIQPAVQPKKQKSKPKRRSVDDDELFDFAAYKDSVYWTEYDPKNPTYYAADGETQYNPGSQRDTSATGSPRKRTRGGGGTRGRGGGNGNGSGRGRGKPRGRGGRDETPEPPPRKRFLTTDEEELVRKLKARQQELKRFFSVVGTYQVEVLDQLAARDLNKLVRRAKAHKGLPEYEDVIQDLQEIRDDVCDTFRIKYDIQLEHEMRRVEQEKEVIESMFRRRCDEAKIEHLQGVEGDMALLKQAHAAAEDDTRTETGSEVDYFPRYHELPEANTRVRGYTSSRITDEKPFKQYLETHDDQARQEVIDEDLIRPMIKAINDRNKEHREELERQKTQNMDSLSTEAIKKLSEIKGYLIPRPLMADDVPAFALSALADVAEWTAQQHPQKQYIYMPLAPSDQFPHDALDFTPLPGQRHLAPAPGAASTSMQTTTSTTTMLPHPHSRSQSQSYINGVGPSSSNKKTPPNATSPTSHSALMQQGPGQTLAPAPPKPKSRMSTSAVTQIQTAFQLQLLPPPPPQRRRPSPHRSSPHQGLFRPNSRPSSRLPGTHQFFLPPQQPVQHQAVAGPSPSPSAPAAAPATFPPGASTMNALSAGTSSLLGAPPGPLVGSGWSSSLGAGGRSTSPTAPPTVAAGSAAALPNVPSPVFAGTSQQGKIPVTFVNQTIASRKAAAAAAAAAASAAASASAACAGAAGGGGGGNGSGKERRGSGSGGSKGGPRMLLPKM